MQNLFPVSVGPSLKTCPRCPLHFLHKTSVLTMPWEKSFLNSTFSVFSGLSKLGHPVPESNFVSEENSSAPHPAQTYMPFSLLLWYLPVKAISVPFSRKTWYFSGLNFFFHSCSDFGIDCLILFRAAREIFANRFWLYRTPAKRELRVSLRTRSQATPQPPILPLNYCHHRD